jgi:KipI family sensor histidine kinase inhibitor
MEPILLPASEASLLVQFGGPFDSELRLDTMQRVHRLVSLLDVSPPAGLREITPAYNSLLVEFDPLATSFRNIEQHLRFLLEKIGQVELPPVRQIEIPVFYGGAYGPDLPWCADYLNMSVSQLVSAHCDLTYTVAFFGFLPGFAYLTGWPSQWALPRLDTPRTQVPASSVALAGVQCGIYPVASPGGWRLLGQTPLKLLDATRDSFTPLEIGAKVRFYPANPKSW